MAKRKIDPVHRGVVLAEDYLKGLEITQYRLAKGIRLSPRRINEILDEPAVALRPGSREGRDRWQARPRG